MKLHKLYFFSGILVLLLLIGCPTDSDGSSGVTVEGGGIGVPYTVDGVPLNGTGSGSVNGYTGSPVIVSLTLVNGFITNVDITHNESPEFGALIIDDALVAIQDTNSSAGIDAITSPTVPDTRRAIKGAVEKALKKIAEGM